MSALFHHFADAPSFDCSLLDFLPLPSAFNLTLPTMPVTTASTSLASSSPRPHLSKRAQRIIRTREAATRNRVEQRAKMARLATANQALTRQTADLQRKNRQLKNDVSLMKALEADPKLLRRVLSMLG